MKIGDIIYYFLVCLFYWWFSNNIFFQNFFPDIVFIGMIIASIVAIPAKAIFISFLFGVFMDVYSSSLFGMHCLFYVVISYLIWRLKYKLDMNSSFSRVVSCITFNYLFITFYSAFYFMYFKSNNIFLEKYLFQPIITVLFFEPLFYFVNRIKRKNNFWL